MHHHMTFGGQTAGKKYKYEDKNDASHGIRLNHQAHVATDPDHANLGAEG